jgi:hypothetical protein
MRKAIAGIASVLSRSLLFSIFESFHDNFCNSHSQVMLGHRLYSDIFILCRHGSGSRAVVQAFSYHRWQPNDSTRKSETAQPFPKSPHMASTK